MRARVGAPVATPLDWSELEDRTLDAGRYTLGTLLRRLDRQTDPWKEIGEQAASLDAPRQRLQAVVAEGNGKEQL